MKEPTRVAFVCLHGSAKSLIAAEHLNCLARSCGVAVEATTSGPEPDAEVPENVAEGLLRRGIDVRNRIPERVTGETLARAGHIVSFGVDLKDLAAADRAVEHWDDCPAVSDDFDTAYAFITGQVGQLFERLCGDGPVPDGASSRPVAPQGGS
jgi:protein-tyrosine-phosphatase